MPSDIATPPADDEVAFTYLDYIGGGLAVFGKDRCLKYANRAFQELLAYPEGLCVKGTSLEAFIRYDYERGLFGKGAEQSPEHFTFHAEIPHIHHMRELYLPDGRILSQEQRQTSNDEIVFVYTDITHQTLLARRWERDNIVVQHLNEGVVLCGLDLRIYYYNPAFVRLFEIEPQKSDALFLPPHDLAANISFQKFSESLEAAIASFGRYSGDVEVTLASGSRRVFHFTIMPRRDSSANHSGYIAIYREITRQANDQKRLLRQDRVIAQLSEAVFVADENGLVLDCNPAVRTLYGYKPEEMKGQHVLDILLPDGPEKDQKKARILRHLSSGDRWSGELSLRTKSGKTVLSDCNVQPFYDDQNNRIGLIGVHRDITERHKAQDAINKQLLIIEHMSEGVVVTNTEGRIEEYNASAYRMFGYDKIEDVSKIKCDILGFIASTVVSNGYYESTYKIKDANGENMYLECLAMPVPSHDGSTDRVVSVHRNVTDKVKTAREREEIAERRERSKRLETLGQMAGGIAHDFNNILTPMLGYTHLARDHISDESQAYQDLGHVIDAMEKARDMVRQILMFGQRVEPPVHTEPFDKTIKSTIELLSGSLPHSVEMTTSFGCDDIHFPCNKTLISQLVMNLCSNAVQAMPDGGTLIIETDKNGDWRKIAKEQGLAASEYVRLRISDTGHGIPACDLDRIYDPFFTTKPPGQGTGLGLSVVHGVVRAHGGAIHVESSAKTGTCFEVYFPTSHANTKSQETKSITIGSGKGRNILVIDDDEDVRSLLDRMLTDLDFSVTCVEDGRDALEVMENGGNYDLILTDLSMPRLDGERLIKTLRRKGITTPIILVTAKVEPRTIREYRDWGADCLLQKPVLPRDLMEAVFHQFKE